jgi:hypothetical protein
MANQNNQHAGVPTGGVGGSIADRLALLEAAVFGGSPFAPSALGPIFQFQPVVHTVAGAIQPNEGLAQLKTGAGSAFTLALPQAGPQSSGGQDGMTITIISLDAEAYTVTTPADGINAADDTMTWGGAIGDSIELCAVNGKWVTVGTAKGVTLSEV